MTRLPPLVATAVAAFALALSSIAWARHDAGPDPCAGLRGSAFGLCNAYTHGMRCSESMPMADREACESVAASFAEATGFPPPSDCPCDFSLGHIRDSSEEWDTGADFDCTQTDTQTGHPDPLTFADRFFKIGIFLGEDVFLDPPTDEARATIDVLSGASAADPIRLEFRCRYKQDEDTLEEVLEFVDSESPDYGAWRRASTTSIQLARAL